MKVMVKRDGKIADMDYVFIFFAPGKFGCFFGEAIDMPISRKEDGLKMMKANGERHVLGCAWVKRFFFVGRGAGMDVVLKVAEENLNFVHMP